MPLQNRVTPFSGLEAVPNRGTLMGNRGILHDRDQCIGTVRWKHKRWIACVLSFKNRRRALMVPGQYTALFFLDEAVSLAAGHRPCRECRRTDYQAFVAAWRVADGFDDDRRVDADAIDAALHLGRIDAGRMPARFRCAVEDLPDGAFFSEPERKDEAWLVWKGAYRRWSHAGYREARLTTRHVEVDVLTPRCTIDVLRAGYVPSVHPSAA